MGDEQWRGFRRQLNVGGKRIESNRIEWEVNELTCCTLTRPASIVSLVLSAGPSLRRTLTRSTANCSRSIPAERWQIRINIHGNEPTNGLRQPIYSPGHTVSSDWCEMDKIDYTHVRKNENKQEGKIDCGTETATEI